MKKGEVNEGIETVEKDPTFEEGTGRKCCVGCNSKDLIRAVLTNDLDLLKTLISDTKNVHSIFVMRSEGETCSV